MSAPQAEGAPAGGAAAHATDPRRLIRTGLVAGLVAAFTFAVFVVLANTPGRSLGASFAATYGFVASVVIGPSAFANPAAPLLGFALHVVVSLSWALAYVYLVQQQPFLLRRPFLSGGMYGLVVYAVMLIVLLAGGQYHGLPTQRDFVIAVVSHVIFYGFPVGIITSRLLHEE